MIKLIVFLSKFDIVLLYIPGHLLAIQCPRLALYSLKFVYLLSSSIHFIDFVFDKDTHFKMSSCFGFALNILIYSFLHLDVLLLHFLISLTH